VDVTRIGWGGMHWIGLGEDRDRRRDLVNTAVKLAVP
jgi:hypothetical protein